MIILADCAWETSSHISTVIACVVAIITLIMGYRQFKQTQDATRETQAINLFIKFNEINSERELSEPNSNHWQDNGKFAITEALFDIRKDSASWRNTVKWMLYQQRTFIDAGDFELETYSEDFRTFCKDHGYELRKEKKRKSQPN